MTRTQIQFPDPLFRRLKAAAKRMDWSLAELLRRSAESYLATLPEVQEKGEWVMPVLRPSGGYLKDPAMVKPEADAIEQTRI